MIERHEEGIRNAARFAIQPNMWGFCGEDNTQEILRSFVSDNGVDSQVVRETLTNHNFPHLNAFLGTIAELNEMDIFDEDVVMSYWFGSYLTEKVGVNTKNNLAENYGKQISPQYADHLKEILPDEMYLTHLSQVALVAASSESEPKKTEFINFCMIAFGVVIEIDVEKKIVKVNREVLVRDESGNYQVKTAKRKVRVDADLTPDLKLGDEVAIHLGYLAAKISSDQAERLKCWTRKVAALI
jgi:hydrogenase maturation factor